MEKFEIKVERLCRELCKKLGIDPDERQVFNDVEFSFERVAWEQFQDLVRDWLVDDAFEILRSEYYCNQLQSVKEPDFQTKILLNEDVTGMD